MKPINKRQQLQGVLLTALFMCLIFSRYKPIYVTAYLVIVFSIMDVFLYIRKREWSHDGGEEANFWPQTLVFLLFQVLLVAFVFGLTWYLFEMKDI